MKYCLIKNGTIVNEGRVFAGHILIEGEYISEIFEERQPLNYPPGSQIIDASNCLVIPGVIDIHVHFREPGLTQKADIWHESRAAVAGGVTTYIDMPNTIPQTTRIENFEDKIKTAKNTSYANYSFYLGATDNNLDQILMADPTVIPGVKIFFGASTGNMNFKNNEAIEAIFEKSKLPILAHCEDSSIINQNLQNYTKIYGDQIPARCHTEIRNHESCILSTKYAISLAEKFNHPLHILHITTKEELNLTPKNKLVSFETCPQYLVFDQDAFNELGHLIKCNPSIKTKTDKEELIKGIQNNQIDTIGSDHAPHELSSKSGNYIQAPSGMPGIQFLLQNMLSVAKKHNIPLAQIVNKMSHKPAEILKIDKRGFLRKGYFADIVMVNSQDYRVEKNKILSKCGWSPFEGKNFEYSIKTVFVNGEKTFDNNIISDNLNGKALKFNRI